MSLLKRLIYAAIGVAVVFLITWPTLPTTVGNAGNATALEVVTAFDKLAIDERKPRAAVLQYVAENFVDHNPDTDGTRAGMLQLLEGQGKWAVGEMQREVKHIFNAGDTIALHQRIVVKPGDPAMAVVDIFRVDNGKIIEHWDVVQAVPAASANKLPLF
jgi:predicted SnoaL-like aldol condensation-catalyzing enzyme